MFRKNYLYIIRSQEDTIRNIIKITNGQNLITFFEIFNQFYYISNSVNPQLCSKHLRHSPVSQKSKKEESSIRQTVQKFFHPSNPWSQNRKSKLHVAQFTITTASTFNGSTIYRRPSTPVHPRAAPKKTEPQRRVSALYFISGTLKAFSIADIVGFRGTRDGLSISWGE